MTACVKIQQFKNQALILWLFLIFNWIFYNISMTKFRFLRWNFFTKIKHNLWRRLKEIKAIVIENSESAISLEALNITDFRFKSVNCTVAIKTPFSVYFFSTRTEPVKNLKTVRFLEREGSRYKILTENCKGLCTVQFALFNDC